MAGAMTDITKDVYSLNEMNDVNGILHSINEWVIDNSEFDNAKPVAVMVVLADGQGHRFGSITRYGKDDDVKFEPGFVPAEVAVMEAG